MLIVISPAKTLDFESESTTPVHTQPEFVEDSEKLIRKLRSLSRKKLTEMMGISKDLAQLNYERYLAWEPHFHPGNSKQAVLAFKGDVYIGLDAATLSEEDLAFAQDHLRILSGLYGLLRPLDLMQPYRLEMGTKLPVRRKKNLYDFWGSSLTDKVNLALAEQGIGTLINLASNEYFNVLQPSDIQARIITPTFLDQKNGVYKPISFFLKKARGLMSSYIIRNRLTDPEALKDFNYEGYYYDPERSEGEQWVFLRDEAK
ncbi:MAG: peroxide stress protein YaaA [Bacteroidota bacterium]